MYLKFFSHLRKTFYNANKKTQNVPKSYIKSKASRVRLDLQNEKIKTNSNEEEDNTTVKNLAF